MTVLKISERNRDGIIAATATSIDENDLAVLDPEVVIWSETENTEKISGGS